MHRLTIAAIVSLVCVLVAGDALAQGRGRGGRFGGGAGRGGQMNKATLLSIPAVAEDLGLSEEQKSGVASLQEEARGQRRGQRGQRGERPNFRDMSEEDRQAMRDERREQAEAQRKEAEGKLKELLDDRQMERLNEIALQIQGANALLTEPVQQKLSLSEETVSELQQTANDTRRETREQMRDIFGGGDRENAMQKMRELQEQTNNKLLGVLSAEQRQQFEQMQGAKLELSQEDLRNAMRGGRGQRGQRGNRGNRGAQGGGGGGRPELE